MKNRQKRFYFETDFHFLEQHGLPLEEVSSDSIPLFNLESIVDYCWGHSYLWHFYLVFYFKTKKLNSESLTSFAESCIIHSRPFEI